MNSPASEIVQIVDRENSPTGSAPRAMMRQKRLIHRASYILVFNSSGEIYVQKRTLTKDVYPGYWDLAAGGVVLADESYDQSAKRELGEELGVHGTTLQQLFDHFHETATNRVWGRVYRCFHNGPFTLQEEEIEYGMFMSFKEILALNRQEPFTPDGIEILHRVMNSSFPAPKE